MPTWKATRARNIWTSCLCLKWNLYLHIFFLKKFNKVIVSLLGRTCYTNHLNAIFKPSWHFVVKEASEIWLERKSSWQRRNAVLQSIILDFDVSHPKLIFLFFFFIRWYLKKKHGKAPKINDSLFYLSFQEKLLKCFCERERNVDVG